MISSSRLAEDALDTVQQGSIPCATRTASMVGVAEGYDRWAPTYDSVPNPLIACEERYLSPLLPNLRGRCALDLACGTGRWLQRLLHEEVALALGVDMSKAMLRTASRKSELTGRLARANCLSLPFGLTVFDFAICSFAVSHVRDLVKFADELFRVTKPGAEVYVSDLHAEASAQGWRTGFRDSDGSAEIETVPRTSEQIRHTFQEAGWECVAYRSWSIGEEEKPIFEQAGRVHFFEAARAVPAIMFLHFRRATVGASTGHS